jgi:hypothetical protein
LVSVGQNLQRVWITIAGIECQNHQRPHSCRQGRANSVELCPVGTCLPAWCRLVCGFVFSRARKYAPALVRAKNTALAEALTRRSVRSRIGPVRVSSEMQTMASTKVCEQRNRPSRRFFLLWISCRQARANSLARPLGALALRHKGRNYWPVGGVNPFDFLLVFNTQP